MVLIVTLVKVLGLNLATVKNIGLFLEFSESLKNP